MSTWERIKNWFRSESRAARDWSADVEKDLSTELDRKEADLRATPAEKLENLQEQISGNTETFDEIEGKIAAKGIDPEADTGPSDAMPTDSPERP